MAKRSHICILHSYGFNGSGSSIYTFDLARALVNLGYEVSVLCHETRLEHLKNKNKQLNLKELHIPYCETQYEPHIKVFSLYTNKTFVAYDRPELSNTCKVTQATKLELLQYTDELYKFINFLNCKKPIDQILVNHLSVLNLVASKIKKECKIPFKTIVHGTFLEYTLLNNVFLKELLSLSISSADCVFVLNESVKSRFKKVFKFHDGPVEIVPPGLSQSYIDRSPGERGEDSNSMAIPSKKIITYVGRISLDKGLHCLLAILPLLSLKHKFTLKIAGVGPDIEFLQQMIETLKQGQFNVFYEECVNYIMKTRDKELSQLLLVPLHMYFEKFNLNKVKNIKFDIDVDWLGHVSRRELKPLYKSSEYNILTSIVPEAHPLVICEALACGTITVAKNFSGISELYSDLSAHLSGSLENTYCLENNHNTFVEELFLACDNILSNNKFKNYSSQFIEFAAENYSWVKLADKIVNLSQKKINTLHNKYNWESVCQNS